MLSLRRISMIIAIGEHLFFTNETSTGFPEKKIRGLLLHIGKWPSLSRELLNLLKRFSWHYWLLNIELSRKRAERSVLGSAFEILNSVQGCVIRLCRSKGGVTGGWSPAWTPLSTLGTCVLLDAPQQGGAFCSLHRAPHGLVETLSLTLHVSGSACLSNKRTTS